MEAAAKLLEKLSSLAELKENAPDPTSIHLPFLVCLLESVGYQLRKMDCVNPKNMFRKSTTIVVSCGLSGQRCFLELPEDKDECNCLVKGQDSSEFFLEAFSNGKSETRWLEESSSQHCIPYISKELKSLSNRVLQEIVQLMKENFREMDHVHSQMNLASNNNYHSSTPNMNIPDIITTEVVLSPNDFFPTKEDIVEQNSLKGHFESEGDSQGVAMTSTTTASRIFGQTYIVSGKKHLVIQSSTNTISTKSTNSTLRRSISDSGKKSLIPKQNTSKTLRNSTSNLKACSSSENLRINQASTETNSIEVIEPVALKRSISDTGRHTVFPKQTITSTLRKSTSNLKVDNGPAKTMPKLMQTAKNIITRKSTSIKSVSQAKNKKVDTNLKSNQEEKNPNVSIGKSPTIKATTTSTTNLSSAINSNKTSVRQKISSRVGAALLSKPPKK